MTRMVLGNTTEKPPTPPPAQVASVVDGRVSPPLPETSSSGATLPNMPPPFSAADVQPVALTEETRKEVVEQLVDAYATWEVNLLSVDFGSTESAANYVEKNVSLSYRESRDHPLTEDNFDRHCIASTKKQLTRYKERVSNRIKKRIGEDTPNEINEKIASIIAGSEEEKRPELEEKFTTARNALKHISDDDLNFIKASVKEQVSKKFSILFLWHSAKYFMAVTHKMKALLLPYRLDGILTSIDNNSISRDSEVWHDKMWYQVTDVQIENGLGQIKVMHENMERRIITIEPIENPRTTCVKCVKIDGQVVRHPNLYLSFSNPKNGEEQTED